MQTLQVNLNEKELHILSWLLSQVSNETVAQIYWTGKMYGLVEEDHAIMDLYQRLMKEWDEWAKNQ